MHSDKEKDENPWEVLAYKGLDLNRITKEKFITQSC